MPNNTYVALDKKTISGSSTTSITFTGISQAYTDLIIVNNGAAGAFSSVKMQFNGDTTSSYGSTRLYADSSSPGSDAISANSGAYPAMTQTDNGTNIINIMNYAQSNTYKTILSRSANTGSYDMTMACVWLNTAAINSVTIYTSNGTNFSAGSTFSLYGVKAWAAEVTPKATGGYVYSDSTYWYHAFPFTSTFTPLQSLSVDYLVVAGGGGTYLGGGGAGGLRQGSAFSVTATPYTITVGAGGNYDANGSNSSFSTISATGGGRSYVAQAGASGGSGGGGTSVQADPAVSGGAGNAGGYSPVEGYAGGSAAATYSADQGQQNGGGGGGAGGVGGNGLSAPVTGGGGGVGGNGGIGATSTLINTIGNATGFGQLVSGNYYFAGGGGGGGVMNGAGGYGGGGSGVASEDTNGAANTGGGAGGAKFGETRYGLGGSGIVVIRYAK